MSEGGGRGHGTKYGSPGGVVVTDCVSTITVVDSR